MAYAAEVMIHASPESIGRARGTLVKALYLKRVKRLLESDPNAIITRLEEIRQALCQLSNFRVLVVANIEKLQKPVSSWEVLAANLDNKQPLIPLDTRLSRLSAAGKKPGNLAYIIPLSTIDSSFALSIAKGPESLEDPLVPALMVAISYLDAVEGPLWTAVRGTGLAYGTSFSRHVESGQISFDIYRSPDAFKAFAASKEVLENFVSGRSTLDSLALEGAISSIVLGFANGQATMASAAQGSFIRQVIRGLSSDWNDVMLKRVREVGVDEIKKVMKDILLPAFVPETANIFVTCAPIMEEVSLDDSCLHMCFSDTTKDLVKHFEGIGFKPEVKPLAFFQDDYGLKAEDGEDEEDGIDGIDGDEDEDEDTEEGDGVDDDDMSDKRDRSDEREL